MTDLRFSDLRREKGYKENKEKQIKLLLNKKLTNINSKTTNITLIEIYIIERYINMQSLIQQTK